MHSLQLRHLVCSKSTNKVHFKSQCPPQSYQSQSRLSANFHQTLQSMIGLYVPALNGKQSAHNMGVFCCALASANPVPSKEIENAVKAFTTGCVASVVKVMHKSQLLQQCAPAIGLMAFAMWGLGPLLRFIHQIILCKEDRSWKESQLNHGVRMYVRPVLLWVGVILICRAFDPVVLSTQTSQAIKQRFVNFVRSLSTVLAFAHCTNSAIQHMHKVMLDRQDTQDSRSLGAQFVGNAVYTAVWIAAVCLFMELLGFSTQKWLTAGGLGTVLLTLAGREIFTNFLSSIMIHATRPFVHNEWIQTKIDGYEVSGTVEHVGWWSPTIVRGDDREAVHIPNHKFTVSVVRNLSQKSHWRIKTYFGISHLDVAKLSNIVADMRKVLAKHPQVEQRRLHRRVFFESISSENQALMVLVSCFVKTPHFEEYLRVKEVILLDLMKVISHHHARLATPIRSMQRVIDDIDPRSAPFRDTNRPAESQGRQYLLIEATTVANTYGDDQSANSKNGSALARDDSVNADGDESDSEQTKKSPKKDVKVEISSIDGISESGNFSVGLDSKIVTKHKSQLEGLDSMGLNSKDITLLGAAFEKPLANITEDSISPQTHREPSPKPISSKSSVRMEPNSSNMADQSSQPSQKLHAVVTEHTDASSEEKMEKTRKNVMDLDAGSSRDEKEDARKEVSETDSNVDCKTTVDQKIDLMRLQLLSASSSTGELLGTKSQLEDNLVLGVALNGPKQTLPLDNEIKQRELVGTSNGISGNVVKEVRSGSQSLNKSHSECRGIANAAENIS